MHPHRKTVGSRDRLTVTLFLAALFHMILILGISFSPPLADSGDVPTLEVLLVLTVKVGLAPGPVFTIEPMTGGGGSGMLTVRVLVPTRPSTS